MNDKVAVIANYCTILSFPCAVLSVVIAAVSLYFSLPHAPGAGPSSANAAAQVTPSPSGADLNEPNSTYAGQPHFWGDDFVSRFFERLTGILGRWIEEHPVAAGASAVLFGGALVLYTIGSRSKARK